MKLVLQSVASLFWAGFFINDGWAGFFINDGPAAIFERNRLNKDTELENNMSFRGERRTWVTMLPGQAPACDGSDGY